MRITRILPKPFAIAWQEYDLNKIESTLMYYKTMVRVLEQRFNEGREELQRLRGHNWK